jgi:poly(ADP-ribose) glycohydrolase ARH3
MEEEMLKSKFRGALLGVAVGDALGAPFEGSLGVHHERLKALAWNPGPMRYTDDTHMTIGVSESLIARRDFDGEHMAHTFAEAYDAEPWRGYGAGPPQIFAMLRLGVPWDNAALTLFEGRGSFGNGAAMRAAPAALLAYSDLHRVRMLAGQTAIITHVHPLGVEGAVLQACAVAMLISRMPHSLYRELFLKQLRYIHPWSSTYAQKLDRMKALLKGSPPGQVVAQLGNGIAAHEAVPTAIYAFLRHPESFSDAVCYAIGLGGDTDTIASMTGALSGAYLGEEGIPEVWRERVEGVQRLRGLADALLSLAAAEEA